MRFSTSFGGVALVLVLGQPGSQSLAGTWIMDFGGQTFARLELRTTGGVLSGRISLGAMHLNDQGEIDRVLKPATNFTALFDVVYRGGVLSFARKDEDDTDRFELRLIDTAEDAAQLSFVMTDELLQELKNNGSPPPKPIALRRSSR
jgi:hypothetical protein